MATTYANEARAKANARRLDQLVQLRLQRPLTEAEQAEESTLERRLAHRVWRQQQADEARRLQEKINTMAAQPRIEEFA